MARDASVTRQTNRYSVPWNAAGHDVALREREDVAPTSFGLSSSCRVWPADS